MSKSKGQHYLQASWAGHFFNYGNNINTSGQGRLKKLHVIDLKVVFDTKRKNINNLELENLIHTKKAENLFSGYEISLETEKKINVEKYEYIDYDKSEIMINGTFTDSFKKHKLPFMALQQSRNIQVFEYYKNIYNTGALNKDFYFQMAIQSDKNILHDNIYEYFLNNLQKSHVIRRQSIKHNTFRQFGVL